MPREQFIGRFDAAMYVGLRGLAVVATVMAVAYGVKSGTTDDPVPPKIFGLKLPNPYGEITEPVASKDIPSSTSSTISISAKVFEEPLGPITP